MKEGWGLGDGEFRVLAFEGFWFGLRCLLGNLELPKFAGWDENRTNRKPLDLNVGCPGFASRACAVSLSMDS